jgi:hypothetical protein
LKYKLTGSSGKNFSVLDVVQSPKYMRPQRAVDFLLRYERIIQKENPAWKLDFTGKNVLEVGSGPLLGFAPFAVFMGCRQYVCLEPMYNPEILNHPKVRKYFLMIHKDLTALYGKKMSFEDFFQAITQKVSVYSEPLETFEKEYKFDIILSNSCLEHIQDLKGGLKNLKRISFPQATFLHVVDFGNHSETINPFHRIYMSSPEDYFKRYGRLLNLLRPPDMMELFKINGIDAKLVPYYNFDEMYSESIHPWWKEKYSLQDLFLKTAFIINKI